MTTPPSSRYEINKDDFPVYKLFPKGGAAQKRKRGTETETDRERHRDRKRETEG